MADQLTEYPKTWKIPFEDHQYSLSTEWLDKNVDKEKNSDWRWPALKFHSYKNGVLTLLNTHTQSSYYLILKVKDQHLLVKCSCGSKDESLCKHARSGLSILLIMQGKGYFKKLIPNAEFDLAFSYPGCFDKKESAYGINVTPRPELKSVFILKNETDTAELQGILNMPVEVQEEYISPSGHTIAYLVLMPWNKVILPAVLPCAGQLTKDRSNIKFWTDFLHRSTDKFDNLIIESNHELIADCNKLWDQVTEGHNPRNWNERKRSVETISKAFDLWNKVYPLLRKQTYVYAYKFNGVAETKKKPSKQKTIKVKLSERIPFIKFLLLDKGPFYEFQMQFWLDDDEPLEQIEFVTQYFILNDGVIYNISELRDALIIDWMLDTGGWITVFKEHYDQFAEEMLIPLLGKYPVDVIPAKRKKSKFPP